MITQLTMMLEATTTRRKRRDSRKPLETPTDAPQARTGAGAGNMCRRCGQGPVRPGQQCGWCGKRNPATEVTG